MNIIALVPAASTGRRMGADKNKQYLEKPVGSDIDIFIATEKQINNV